MSATETSTQQGEYVQANGIDIYYEEYGSGEPLLLIHGGVVNHTMWAKHIPIFAKHFRVIAPDSRGHGRTMNPSNIMNYRLFADDMAAFIQALRLQQPLVCGYSDGGQIELEMGMHYPQLAKAYVVGGACYKWPEVYVPIMNSWGMESPGVVNIERIQRDGQGMIQLLQENGGVFQGPEYWKSYLLQVSHMWMTPWHYTDEELKKISEPTLLLAGDRDDFAMPVEQAVHMYRTLPKAELAIAPGSGHDFFRSKAELFTALILDFLLRQSPSSA